MTEPQVSLNPFPPQIAVANIRWWASGRRPAIYPMLLHLHPYSHLLSLTLQGYLEYLRQLLSQRRYSERFSIGDFCRRLTTSEDVDLQIHPEEVESMETGDFLSLVPVIGARPFDESNHSRARVPPPFPGQQRDQPLVTMCRGFTDPLVLQKIGTTYSLTLDNLLHHLAFPGEPRLSLTNQHTHSEVATPLTIRTTCLAESFNPLFSAAFSSTERQKWIDAQVKSYHQGLYTLRFSGRDVYRHVTVHDSHHFSVEQQMTMHICPKNRGWDCIILTDIGIPASKPPWLLPGCSDDSVQFYSVHERRYSEIPTSPKASTKRQHTKPTHPDPYTSRAQEAPSLGESFREACRTSPFIFALDPIQTSLLGWSQLLDFLSIMRSGQDALSQEEADEVQRKKVAAERALAYIFEIRRFIQRRGNPGWPPVPNLSQNLEQRLENLSADLNMLENQAKNLSCRCNDDMALIMNRMSIKESHKGLVQAKRSALLTGLAFIFIPLAFVSSVFGMNVREITGDAEQPEAKWVGITAVSTLAIVLLAIPSWKLMKRCLEIMWPRI